MPHPLAWPLYSLLISVGILANGDEWYSPKERLSSQRVWLHLPLSLLKSLQENTSCLMDFSLLCPVDLGNFYAHHCPLCLPGLWEKPHSTQTLHLPFDLVKRKAFSTRASRNQNQDKTHRPGFFLCHVSFCPWDNELGSVTDVHSGNVHS